MRYDKLLEYVTGLFVASFMVYAFRIPLFEPLGSHISNFAISGCLLIFLILTAAGVQYLRAATPKQARNIVDRPLEPVSPRTVVVIVGIVGALNIAIEVLNIHSLGLGSGYRFTTTNTPDIADALAGILATLPVLHIAYRRRQAAVTAVPNLPDRHQSV